MKINQNIFQLYIQNNDSDGIPNGITSCIETILNKKGDFDHYLLGNDALREIINNNLGPEAVNAYDKLKPYTYKADFGRHCLLYLFGGWYFDASVRLNVDLTTFTNMNLVVFKDAPNPGLPSWDLSTSVIYGEKESKIFEIMIKEIIKNTEIEFYGTTPLSPTGPTLFGRCLATLGEKESTLTGLLTPLTPLHKNKNYAFVLPDGSIFAWGKSSWGTQAGDGLSAFATKGTNSYNEMYYSRKVYSI